MIRTFCDCCGKEIPNHARLNTTVFPAKRVGIDMYPDSGGYITDFMVELVVTANIYKPGTLLDELLGEITISNFIGHNICKNCIVETLTQEER